MGTIQPHIFLSFSINIYRLSMGRLSRGSTMKMRRTILFSFCLTVALFSTGIAYAQTPTPAPGPTITTQTAIVAILALIVGYIGQAVQTGSVFGIATTPKAWIPYLTLLGSFLGAFGISIQ